MVKIPQGAFTLLSTKLNGVKSSSSGYQMDELCKDHHQFNVAQSECDVHLKTEWIKSNSILTSVRAVSVAQSVRKLEGLGLESREVMGFILLLLSLLKFIL